MLSESASGVASSKPIGVSASNSLVRRLVKHRWLHHVIRVFRVQAMVNGVLSFKPLVRRTPKLGIRYRIRYLEGGVVADEIFAAQGYAPAFAGRAVRSFIDLGCNVGYFCCFAAEATQSRDLVGLAVDANRAMVAETRWHLAENQLDRVRAVHGVVGLEPGVKEATFFVAASNVASSAQPHQNPLVPQKGKLRAEVVPAVDLLALWKEQAGDMRVDLLKIDVEGSELDVIRNSAGLLAITEALVIEWHKWVVTQSAVEAALALHGFRLTQLVSDDENAGVGVFARS
jgi:FkbM family methyltransferase